METQSNRACGIFGTLAIDLSEADILSAMKSLRGYIDITPSDFREIYGIAFRHAVDRMAQGVRARDIMTAPVITVKPDTLLTETARKMADAGISGVPVVDAEGKVVGVISEKDFLAHMGAPKTGAFMQVIADCLAGGGCVAMPIRRKTAADIMTAPARTAPPDTPVSDLSKQMAEQNINRIPIVETSGRLMGIISRGDLIQSYCAKIF